VNYADDVSSQVKSTADNIINSTNDEGEPEKIIEDLISSVLKIEVVEKSTCDYTEGASPQKFIESIDGKDFFSCR